MSDTPITVLSENPQNEKLEALKNLFPEAFSEGKLNTTILAKTLGEESISNEKEAYGMTWAGKSDARKQILTPTTKTLIPDEGASVDYPDTENILIEGDNLEVLKLLQKSYGKQIKMIYIDPPYNTGKDFVYDDNFHTSTGEYEEATGQRDSEGNRLIQNTETNGRYHSDWLSMMYPRLHLARNLLREDGLIFISIDDYEFHNLKRIMDEIFGEENFINKKSFIWHIPNGTNKGFIARAHEYILGYARNIEKLKPFHRPGSLNTNSVKHLTNAPGPKNKISKLFFKKGLRCEDTSEFTITGIVGGEKEPIKVIGEMNFKDGELQNDVFLESSWKNKAQIETYMKGEIAYDEKGQIISEVFFKKNGKPMYAKDLTSYSPKSVQQFSHTSEEISLIEDFQFSNPKPVRIPYFLAGLCTEDNDIILDFFAGSGTTGHGIMKLNYDETIESQEENSETETLPIVGKRKFILVQLDEDVNKESLPYGKGFTKISEITAERLRRVGTKIREENHDISLDTGFRMYRLDESCYQVASVEYRSENSQYTMESLEKSIQSGLSPLREGAKEADVMVEVLLKEGFPLTSVWTEVQIGENSFLHTEYAGKQLYMSFESLIAVSTILALGKEYSEAILVVYDSALDDSRKVMLASRVKLRTI